MASCIEKIDDEFIEELRDVSENVNTKKHKTLKERFYEVEKWKTNRKKSKRTASSAFA